MKVLVVGQGGREHALAWSLAQSADVSEVFVAPGNAGTAREAKVRNLDVVAADQTAVLEAIREHAIDLTIIGPENAIVDGLGDVLRNNGHRCLAPSKYAARLEGSKAFAKKFMTRLNIPTANSLATTDLGEAIEYIEESHQPIVIKADGLAAGKGVIVAYTHEDAFSATNRMLSGMSFGPAGKTVVIEEFLEGEEASFIVLTDGENVVPFATSQDHKPAYDGDEGPNTGGMGAYSPAPVIDDDVYEKVMQRIIFPTIRGMRKNKPYQGFLYVGLMICNGDPYVVEYNCRFGDPEAQPVLMRLQSDFASLCLAATEPGGLKGQQLKFIEDCAVAVVLASEGYPEWYETNIPITGLEEDMPNTNVFHAGTKEVGDQIVTDGGRVLSVVGQGPTVEVAQRRAYERAKTIHWPGVHMRTDIGHRAIARETDN